MGNFIDLFDLCHDFFYGDSADNLDRDFEFGKIFVEKFQIKNEVDEIIKIKEIKLHAVLESNTSEGLKRFQNRNRNSVLNMKLIFNTYITKGKRHEIFARKKWKMITNKNLIVVDYL